MQEIKQAGQNRLGEERLLRGGGKWFRCTKWLWESSLPQTACLTQEIKLADVPLRFWALNSTGAEELLTTIPFSCLNTIEIEIGQNPLGWKKPQNLGVQLCSQHCKGHL